MTNIYTINSAYAFAETLVYGLVQRYGRDPIVLSTITLLLPNRRSCQAVREAFLRYYNGAPTLLPSMIPLGDVAGDETLWPLQLPQQDMAPMAVISPVAMRLTLTQLIEAWQQSRAAHSGEKITISQAAFLAIELAEFLEEVEREQCSFATMAQIVPEEFAEHWQITLDFLQILSKEWPAILEQQGKTTFTRYRNLALAAQARYWQNHPPEHPVIAAGSTGSIPATAELLNVIAHLPQGAVVLPGLDQYLEEEAWALLEESHPQFGMKQLLGRLQLPRQQVQHWQSRDGDRLGGRRVTLLSEIMRPGQTTERWQALRGRQLALENMSYIEASSIAEEAQVVALILRQVLDTPGKTAALVTEDRLLARRVSALMQQWGVVIDDSAGKPLSHVPAAVFLQLVLEVAQSRAAPVSLLACLKHPYAACGMGVVPFRQQVRNLERASLRGVRTYSGFDELCAHASPQNAGWLAVLAEQFAPLMALLEREEVHPAELLKVHVECALALANTDMHTGAERLWAKEDGLQLKEFIEELQLSLHGFKTIDPADYQGLLQALLVGQTYRPTYGSHPRLAILGPMEARMIPFDAVILGGLNEGNWPGEAKLTAWMSRPMRQIFGLPLPERNIGLLAHDFVQLCCAPHVYLTRHAKSQGAQTIPSRWLLTLQTLLSLIGQEHTLVSEEPWLEWARQQQAVKPLAQAIMPMPKPPVAARPSTLPVTAIETWRRNPYAIYAQRILGLRALQPIDKEPGAMEFGQIVHKTLERFVQNLDTDDEAEATELLLRCGREELARQSLPAAIEAFWWSRFETVADWFVRQELRKRAMRITVLAEAKGQYLVPDTRGFTVTAKADRLEISPTREVTIIDYKTGGVPSQTDINLGFAPQLTIEALIAQEGGFAQQQYQPTGLEYWKIRGGRNPVAEKRFDQSMPEWIDQAKEGLTRLIQAFEQQDTPYLCCPDPQKAPRYNDYEHLERRKEWEEVASEE